jgi:hypothetical protein
VFLQKPNKCIRETGFRVTEYCSTAVIQKQVIEVKVMSTPDIHSRVTVDKPIKLSMISSLHVENAMGK